MIENARRCRLSHAERDGEAQHHGAEGDGKGGEDDGAGDRDLIERHRRGQMSATPDRAAQHPG
jgi:hypothetical protein